VGLQGPQGPAGAAGTFSASDITLAVGSQAQLCVFGGGSCDLGISIATCPTNAVAFAGCWAGDIINGTPAINGPDPSSSSAWEWSSRTSRRLSQAPLKPSRCAPPEKTAPGT
jgi:hypothetical protein